LFDTQCDQLLALQAENQFARFSARRYPPARHAICGAASVKNSFVQSHRQSVGAIRPIRSQAKYLKIAKPHKFFTDV
jgi:hypothetical protein